MSLANKDNVLPLLSIARVLIAFFGEGREHTEFAITSKIMLNSSGVSGHYFVPFHSEIASGVSKRRWAAPRVDTSIHICMQIYSCMHVHVHVHIAGEEGSHRFLFFGMSRLEWVLHVVRCPHHKWNVCFFP